MARVSLLRYSNCDSEAINIGLTLDSDLCMVVHGRHL